MIRPAIMAEADAIRACGRAAFARYVPRMRQDPAPMHADIAAHIGLNEVSVALDPAGDVLGYAICREEGGEMHLDTVAVWPDHAGRGLGKRLIAHVEELARKKGLTAVTLYTNAAMTENIAMYGAMGYVENGRRQQDGFDRVFFRKALV